MSAASNATESLEGQLARAAEDSLAEPQLLIRGLEANDAKFVCDSWTKSYQTLMPIHAKTYGLSRYDWVWSCATRLIYRPSMTTLIAYLDVLPDVILGWACGERDANTLHYVYVKGGARRRGIAKSLVAALGIGRPAAYFGADEPAAVRMTHRPGKVQRAKSHERGWRFEPLTKEELEV